MRFDVVLRTFTEFFEREKIRYAVIGGLAMQAWGASRFTKDADIAVSRGDREAIVRYAESIGYETLNLSDGYSNHHNPNQDFGRIDFMYLDETTAERVFKAASSKAIIGDLTAPVASPEHLAMMKGLAMKFAPQRIPYEGEDVRLLLKLPGVDTALIREYFDRQGMLGLFDAIWKTR